jgi:hypothetical protein
LSCITIACRIQKNVKMFVLIGLMVVMASEDGVAWFNGCHG